MIARLNFNHKVKSLYWGKALLSCFLIRKGPVTSLGFWIVLSPLIPPVLVWFSYWYDMLQTIDVTLVTMQILVCCKGLWGPRFQMLSVWVMYGALGVSGRNQIQKWVSNYFFLTCALAPYNKYFTYACLMENGLFLCIWIGCLPDTKSRLFAS